MLVSSKRFSPRIHVGLVDQTLLSLAVSSPPNSSANRALLYYSSHALLVYLFVDFTHEEGLHG